MVLNYQKNVSLQPFNTFGIPVKAKKFIGVKSSDELIAVLNQNQEEPLLILGGGSNVLLTQDFDGLIVRMESKGIEIIHEDSQQAEVRVAAGENWHEFVMWCLKNDLGGVENLALIPGSVGAAPIQNIGAYGVELESVFDRCEAISLSTKQIEVFTKTDCEFGYRNSVFKKKLKGKYIISNVTFKLNKPPHRTKTSYKGLSEKLKGVSLDILSVAQAVMSIRSAKLPDPKKIGNSGSFFKNPVVSSQVFTALKKQYPEIPNHPAGSGKVKIPAAWLIDCLGFKGYRKNDAGVHKKQALVLVNYGNASGAEIFELAQTIQAGVQKTFDIGLEYEVNIL